MPLTNEIEFIDISSDDSNDPQYTNNENGKGETSTPLPEQGRKRKLVTKSGQGPPKMIKCEDTSLHKSKVTFKDVGGLDEILKQICKLVVHIRRPEMNFQFDISPLKGVLLQGPPGCGKTFLAQAIAGVSSKFSQGALFHSQNCQILVLCNLF